MLLCFDLNETGLHVPEEMALHHGVLAMGTRTSTYVNISNFLCDVTNVHRQCHSAIISVIKCFRLYRHENVIVELENMHTASLFIICLLY